MIEVVISPNSELMMTMELLVYPALTILMLLLIYTVIGPRDQIVRYVTHNLDINVDKCGSEDCVRYEIYSSQESLRSSLLLSSLLLCFQMYAQVVRFVF